MCLIIIQVAGGSMAEQPGELAGGTGCGELPRKSEPVFRK